LNVSERLVQIEKKYYMLSHFGISYFENDKKSKEF